MPSAAAAATRAARGLPPAKTCTSSSPATGRPTWCVRLPYWHAAAALTHPAARHGAGRVVRLPRGSTWTSPPLPTPSPRHTPAAELPDAHPAGQLPAHQAAAGRRAHGGADPHPAPLRARRAVAGGAHLARAAAAPGCVAARSLSAAVRGWLAEERMPTPPPLEPRALTSPRPAMQSATARSPRRASPASTWWRTAPTLCGSSWRQPGPSPASYG